MSQLTARTLDQRNAPTSQKFSIFISARSLDYLLAQQVYDFLCEHGLTCFFAPKSIPEVGMSQYALVINNALEEAKHLVLVTSSPAYVRHDTAPWVYYEWSTFHALALRGDRGNLVTVLGPNVVSRDLPIPLSTSYQTIRLADLTQLLAFVGSGADGLAAKADTSETPPDPLAGSSLSPLEKLRRLPGRTGLVPQNAIFAKLARHFSEAFGSSTVSTDIITRANLLRAEADPDLPPYSIIVPLGDLPELGKAGARSFWQTAWDIARLKGVRTIGSFLLSAEEEQDAYPEPLRNEVSRFVDLLHHIEQAPKPI